MFSGIEITRRLRAAPLDVTTTTAPAERGGEAVRAIGRAPAPVTAGGPALDATAAILAVDSRLFGGSRRLLDIRDLFFVMISF